MEKEHVSGKNGTCQLFIQLNLHIAAGGRCVDNEFLHISLCFMAFTQFYSTPPGVNRSHYLQKFYFDTCHGKQHKLILASCCHQHMACSKQLGNCNFKLLLLFKVNIEIKLCIRRKKDSFTPQLCFTFQDICIFLFIFCIQKRVASNHTVHLRIIHDCPTILQY